MPDSLESIASAVRACRLCLLASGRKNAVPGEGPADARIMFIGEGPGFHEDQQGRPFVGPSGQLLESLLASIGMNRRDVFIANVIKCRPPGNRDPEPTELSACRDYLDRQIAVIRPRIIVTLGRFSMQRYFPGQSITRIHGKPKRVGDVYFLPMFHPAAALRNPEWRSAMTQDIALIPRLLAELAEQSAPAPVKTLADQQPPTRCDDEFQQLTLF